MFRTGDLAHRTPAGEVKIIGRVADRVTVLGLPVRTGEVEAVLSRFPGVADVAVVAREIEPGNRHLVAYLILDENHDWDVTRLREYALDSLPGHMVPAAFLVLDAMPLTPDGRQDYRALPAPDFENASRYQAPRTTIEEILCSIFAEVLGVGRVGVGDSFFHLGGQSQLALRLTERVRSALDVDLPVGTLYDAPTVAALAEELAKFPQGGRRDPHV
jgi:hypothetical protein